MNCFTQGITLNQNVLYDFKCEEKHVLLTVISYGSTKFLQVNKRTNLIQFSKNIQK